MLTLTTPLLSETFVVNCSILDWSNRSGAFVTVSTCSCLVSVKNAVFDASSCLGTCSTVVLTVSSVFWVNTAALAWIFLRGTEEPLVGVVLCCWAPYNINLQLFSLLWFAHVQELTIFSNLAFKSDGLTDPTSGLGFVYVVPTLLGSSLNVTADLSMRSVCTPNLPPKPTLWSIWLSCFCGASWWSQPTADLSCLSFWTPNLPPKPTL